MRRILLLVFTAFYTFCANDLWGQNVSKEEFDSFKMQMEKRMQGLQDTIKLKDLTLETSKIYYEKASDHLSLVEQANQWYIGLFGFVIGIVVFFLGFMGINYFGIKRYKEETQKELYEKLSLWVGTNRETVKVLVEEQERKQFLKDNTRIMVISHADDKEQKPFVDLKERGFKKIQSPLILDDNFNVDQMHKIADVDIVILDNQHKSKDGNWNFSDPDFKLKLEQLLKLINNKKLYFVYYGENNKWDGRIKSIQEWNEGKDKSIATSITTLRKNLMELIYPSI